MAAHPSTKFAWLSEYPFWQHALTDHKWWWTALIGFQRIWGKLLSKLTWLLVFYIMYRHFSTGSGCITPGEYMPSDFELRLALLEDWKVFRNALLLLWIPHFLTSGLLIFRYSVLKNSGKIFALVLNIITSFWFIGLSYAVAGVFIDFVYLLAYFKAAAMDQHVIESICL